MVPDLTRPRRDVMTASDPRPADHALPGRHAAADADSIARGHVAAGQSRDRSWLVLLAGAVATFALGLVVLVWPKATLNVVAILLGAQLLAFGLARLFAGLTVRNESGGTRAAYVILGLFGLAAGLYCIRHLSVTVVLLAFIVGLFWALHGVVDLIIAAVAGPVPGRWLKATSGLISLLAGLLVIFKPTISLKFLLAVLGAWLMLYGVLLAAWAFRARNSTSQAIATR
jgi:uncharacterized membrane protein HdeD (DUF308 family)